MVNGQSISLKLHLAQYVIISFLVGFYGEKERNCSSFYEIEIGEITYKKSEKLWLSEEIFRTF